MFGMRILNYLNNVPVRWHVLVTTSLVIELYSQQPGGTRAAILSSDETFIDGTSVNVMGPAQRASPAYVAVIGIFLAPYTRTGRIHTSLNSSVF
jgi:hypothetical protein